MKDMNKVEHLKKMYAKIPENFKAAYKLYKDGKLSLYSLCNITTRSKSTTYRYIDIINEYNKLFLTEDKRKREIPIAFKANYELWKLGKISTAELQRRSGVSMATVYNYIHKIQNEEFEGENNMKNFESANIGSADGMQNCKWMTGNDKKLATKMLELRNQQGYCNAEIARALGVAAYKVKELIGPAPKELVLIAQRGNLTNCRERQLAVQRIQAEQAKAQQEMQEQVSTDKEPVVMEYPQKLDVVQGKAVPSLLEVMRALTECQNLLLRMMTAADEAKSIG